MLQCETLPTDYISIYEGLRLKAHGRR